MIRRRPLMAGLSGLLISHGRAAAAANPQPGKREHDMKHISAGALDVAYLESGPAGGAAVILLHGFPYDVHAYDQASEQLAARGFRCIAPYLRGYGPTRFRTAATFRSGQQAALASDLKALMDALGIRTAVLGGYDWGGRAACAVAALWPERVSGLVTCGTAYNLQNSRTATKPISPEEEQRHWYWFYLNSERGRAALTDDRRGFCRALWRDFSPTWKFDDAAYARSVEAFENPDFVDVVLHSYRYRIGAVRGDPALEKLEERLSSAPLITVPTIVLSGVDDGVDPPKPQTEVAPHFPRLRRLTLLQGIGHNLPQEAPAAFIQAVLEFGPT